MNSLELKKKWREGKPTAGMWLRLTDPTVVDMLGDVGFDWLVFDAEHVAFDFQTLQMLFIALKGTPTVPIVRVPWNDLVFIKRVLDIGASGVIVPQISTAADVKAAVAACKYPPVGIRGTGPRRPGRYGRLEREHVQVANDLTIVLVMIETIAAVGNIDDILTVKGLDGLIFGPADLASSMGLFGDATHPSVQEAIDTVIRKARAVRVPFGNGRATLTPDEWLSVGGQIISIGDDEMFIRQAAWASMEVFRKAVPTVQGFLQDCHQP